MSDDPAPTLRLPAVRCLQRPTRLARAHAISVTLFALVMALGCRVDDLAAPPPATDIAEFYWALTLNHHAVTLSTVAPYDTITLTATPRNAAGEPLSGLPALTFTSSDLERVQVSAGGLVRGLQPGTIPVVATLTAGNVTHADTVLVNVTAESPPATFATLSLQPAPGDSAKVAVSHTKVLTARALDADSQTITGLAVYYYTSLDPTTATIDRTTGLIRPIHPGPVTFTATTTAYGITRSDTLPFTIGLPLFAQSSVRTRVGAGGAVSTSFVPDTLVIGTGGNVRWENLTGTPIDVTFDDPATLAPDDFLCLVIASCDAGNIAAFGPALGQENFFLYLRGRRFPVSGVYPYRSTLSGTTGVIIVVDEHATAPASLLSQSPRPYTEP